MMRSILIAVLMGIVILSLVSSCSTVLTGPLPPEELRLLRVKIDVSEIVKFGYPYTVDIKFEADGKPEMKRICFSYSGEEPSCLRNMEVGAGTIKVSLPANRLGEYRLECYVEYIRDGKNSVTNVVGTQVTMRP